MIPEEAVRALVCLCDIVGSRQLTAEQREAVQRRILQLTAEGAGFRVSGGDEFEWRLPDEAASLDRFLRVRLALAADGDGAPGVHLRCGLGRGGITVRSDQGPYAEDGPAYHRARQAMDALRADPPRRRRSTREPLEPGPLAVRWTAWEDDLPRPERDALLKMMDHLLAGWTPAQRQAVARLLGGGTYEEAGRDLGISPQAVQNRLKSANLDLFLAGHAALKAAWEDR